MSSNKILVVGSGLAGLSIAVHLCDEKQKVVLIDNEINYSTLIAAGQINPLVFRRMTKSWRVDEFIPYGINFYKALENEIDSPIYNHITIRRLFSSEQEKEMWLKKEKNEAFIDYMEEITSDDENYNHVKNEFGSGRVKNASYIDAQHFIIACQKKIKKNEGEIRTETFLYDELNPKTGEYKGEKFEKIIFCEGYLNYKNPWFNYLPIGTTKGEVLTIQSEGLSEKEGLNRKCFVLPVGNKTFRVGATYVWKTSDLTLTEEGKQDLTEKFEKLSSYDYLITEHKAGVRPTTPDRRPIVGKNPEFNKLFIFNGLGTKGYMIAPLLTKEFVDYLLNEKPLDKEVILERFKKDEN